MIKKKAKTNSGFMALITAIIISAILLLIVVNLSFTSFYSRSNILDSELKELSSNYAEACVDTALLKIYNDPGYAGGDAVDTDDDGDDDCTIELVTGSTIETQGVYNGQYFTNLEADYDADLTIPRMEEVEHF